MEAEAEATTEPGAVGDLELPNIGGEGGYFDHDEVRAAFEAQRAASLWCTLC
jgi:hypothetical protein